jgi:hypothetical protein
VSLRQETLKNRKEERLHKKGFEDREKKQSKSKEAMRQS